MEFTREKFLVKVQLVSSCLPPQQAGNGEQQSKYYVTVDLSRDLFQQIKEEFQIPSGIVVRDKDSFEVKTNEQFSMLIKESKMWFLVYPKEKSLEDDKYEASTNDSSASLIPQTPSYSLIPSTPTKIKEEKDSSASQDESRSNGAPSQNMVGSSQLSKRSVAAHDGSLGSSFESSRTNTGNGSTSGSVDTTDYPIKMEISAPDASQILRDMGDATDTSLKEESLIGPSNGCNSSGEINYEFGPRPIYPGESQRSSSGSTDYQRGRLEGGTAKGPRNVSSSSKESSHVAYSGLSPMPPGPYDDLTTSRFEGAGNESGTWGVYREGFPCLIPYSIPSPSPYYNLPGCTSPTDTLGSIVSSSGVAMVADPNYRASRPPTRAAGVLTPDVPQTPTNNDLKHIKGYSSTKRPYPTPFLPHRQQKRSSSLSLFEDADWKLITADRIRYLPVGTVIKFKCGDRTVRPASVVKVKDDTLWLKVAADGDETGYKRILASFSLARMSHIQVHRPR